MFYAYILKNPLKDDLAFYVGKGQDRRAYRHFQAIEWKESGTNPHKTNVLKQIKKAGLEPSIEIIPCLTEQQAFDLERDLISKYGRRADGGILTNICLGGEGNSSGEKAVHQYNVYGDFIAEHKSIKQAALSVGSKHSTSIVAACKMNTMARTPHGYVWCYAENTPDWSNLFYKIRPVFIWNLDGTLHSRYKNLSTMHKETTFDISTVSYFLKKEKVFQYPYGFQYSHEPLFPNKFLTKRTRFW